MMEMAMSSYRNKNRGYQALRVWQDAVEFYARCAEVFQRFPYELRRITSQAMASADSVHRNIAEGYCRRSLGDYLNFLNYALGSLGGSVSGLHAYRRAGQLHEDDFDNLGALAFKIENGLLKLVESLRNKKLNEGWDGAMMLRESNELYGLSHHESRETERLGLSQTPNTPVPRYPL